MLNIVVHCHLYAQRFVYTSAKQCFFSWLNQWSDILKTDDQESVIDIKIVSATTLLVCFLSLKETACETSKYKFILLKRLFSFSRKSKFRIVEILSKKKKIILLNNLGSKNSLLMNLASLYHVTNKKKLSKNYIKAITWKLVSGLFVFPKN